MKPEELKLDSYSKFYLNTFSFSKKSEDSDGGDGGDGDRHSFANIILMKPLIYLILFLFL